MTTYFIQAFIYLCAAVIAVPLARRLGLGSVLGYLIAGVIIGPVVGLVGKETATLQHFAEFGVVMMLFLVGLELEPRMLWSMRNRLLGLGGLQVGLTTAAIMGVGLAFGIDWRIALTVGMILALSSTAIVLQTLNEKGLAKTEGGRGAFSVLLFQDIIVIPMLALIPLLQLPELASAASAAINEAHDSHGHLDLVSGLPNWVYAIVVLAAVASVILGGYYLSRPLFRFVAQSGLREVFTATALMLVIGIAALMSLVGLSPALGTFLAGVVLASAKKVFFAGGDLNMLLEYGIRTQHKVSERTESRTVSQLNNFPVGKSPPVVYMTGQQNISLSNSEVKTLKEYLTTKHGMLFCDNGGSRHFHNQFLALMNRVMPDVRPVPIPLDDVIHRVPYQIPYLPYVVPHGGNEALGWYKDGRWVAYYHPGDIGDAWSDGHAGIKAEIWEACYQLGTNVIFYAHAEYSKWLEAQKKE